MKPTDPTARIDVALMRIAARIIQPRMSPQEWGSIEPVIGAAAASVQKVVMNPKVKRTVADLRNALATAEAVRKDRARP